MQLTVAHFGVELVDDLIKTFLVRIGQRQVGYFVYPLGQNAGGNALTIRAQYTHEGLERIRCGEL